MNCKIIECAYGKELIIRMTPEDCRVAFPLLDAQIEYMGTQFIDPMKCEELDDGKAILEEMSTNCTLLASVGGLR